jgi:two-component sensor histidine kinase
MYLSPAVAADSVVDAMLVVSELVTNAVIHGEGEIELRVDREDRMLRGTVTDGGGGFEYDQGSRGTDGLGGRGLRIVAAVSQRWGILAERSQVWFEMTLKSD